MAIHTSFAHLPARRHRLETRARRFSPRKATRHYRYGYKFWLYSGDKRRFALLGVYSQVILVSPALKPVIVQTTANATAKSGQTSLAREADAFWREVVKNYGGCIAAGKRGLRCEETDWLS